MMRIHQLYTHSQLRNFTYLIEGKERQFYCLDPFDADQVLDFLKEHKGKLLAVINTHEHWDHVQGNEKLIEMTGCEVWAHENGEGKIPGLTRKLKKDERLELDENNYLKVMDTPGHTFAHLCLLAINGEKPEAVFTGDTLFNAGVGHCKMGGEMSQLYETINSQFQNLDDDIKVYPGHEYLGNNLRFTLDREPGNACAHEWLKKYESIDPDQENFVTTMKDERQINTFLRLDQKEIQENLPHKTDDQKQVFIQLRQLRDNW